jgi:hypothetical protein
MDRVHYTLNVLHYSMLELDVVVPKESVVVSRNYEFDKRLDIIRKKLNERRNGNYKISDSDVVDENGFPVSKTLITKTANNLGKRIFYSIAVIDNKIFMFGGTDGKKVYGELCSFDIVTLQWKVYRLRRRVTYVYPVAHHKVCIYKILFTKEDDSNR